MEIVLVRELYEERPGQKDLYITYAKDENEDRYYIIQVETGIKYEEAVDVEDAPYTYEATEERIEHEEDEEELTIQ